jgi:hypothetical protein
MLKTAVIVVELTTLKLVNVMPLGRPTSAPAIKPVPVKVTGTEVPWAPLEGLIELSVGTGGVTVNGCELLVPPAVVTLTTPLLALPPMVKVAVIVVELPTTTLFTVMPLGALTVAPAMNPVPVNATGTAVPCAPLEGLIEVSVGKSRIVIGTTLLPVAP